MTFVGDFIDVAAAIADLLRVCRGEPEFDKLLRFRVQEALGFGPGVAEAPLGLVGEFVARPRFQVEEGKDCI